MRYAVVLAGGGGTRLWPASRRSSPKQLLALGQDPDVSLLAATIARLALDLTHVLVVTAAEQAPAVAAALPALPRENILSEPMGKNTAAAVGLAAVYARARDPQAVLAVLPADHHIADVAAFSATLAAAFSLAEARDAIVTIGIRPTRPETGFGYLELGEAVSPVGDASPPDTHRVLRFVEKPNAETAARYLAGHNHLWNGGMFFFSATRILAELERHLPDTFRTLAEIAHALADKGPGAAAAATARAYPHLESVSIDYAVMEKTAGILTLTGDFGWNDIGAWSALGDIRAKDDDGNIVQGLAATHDAHDNIVIAEDGALIALVGVCDLIVVKAGDAVLVMPKHRAQDVKAIVEQLKARNLEAFL